MARAGRRPAPPAAAPGLDVRELIELATEHGLAELEVEQAGFRIRIVREHAPAGAGTPGAGGPAAARATVPAVTAVDEAAGLVKIEAPMVGTFYRAPSPTSPPFVNEGDAVKEGQPLCIIEAMKLMNEIEARVPGRIVKVLVDNAQPVEYGQPLFLLDPSR